MANQIALGVVGVTFDTKQGEADAQKSITAAVGRIATDAAAVWAAKQIFDFGKAGFDELAEAQKVSAQTGVILSNLGATAGVTSGEVSKLAEAQLKLSGVDDEVAQGAENVLLRLGVTGDAFKRATADSNDLTIAMGNGPEGMANAAELLGKALAHPEQAARLLKPAIGGLTAEQQASIKSFQESGDVAGAQGVIFDALEAKVKGSAEAYGKTLPGQVAIAQQSLANMKGELVGGMAPALTVGTKAVTFLTTEIGKLPSGAQAGIGGLVLLGGAVLSLARPVNDVVTLYGKWKTAREAATVADAAGATASAEAALATTAETAATTKQVAADGAAVLSAEARTAALDEMIVSQEAATVASEGATVASGGLLAAAGPLALGLAAVGTAAYFISGPMEGLSDKMGLVNSKGFDQRLALAGAAKAARDAATDISSLRSAHIDDASATDTHNDALRTEATRLQGVEDGLQRVNGYEQARLDMLNGGIDAQIDYSNAVLGEHDQLANLQSVLADTTASQDDITRASNDAETAIISQGKSAVDAYTQAKGSALTATEQIAIQKGEYENIAKTLSPDSDLYKWLTGYIAKLNSTPSTIRTVIEIQQHLFGVTGGGGSGFVTGGGGPQARGGIYHVDQATSFTAGEAGGETAIFIPDNEAMRRGPGLENLADLAPLGGRPGDQHTINIYNPVPEPAADSVARELRRAQYFVGRR